MYSVLKTKEVKHVGSVKSVKCPFISRNVSRNTTQKHHFRRVLTFSTLFWKFKKKIFSSLFFINIFVWTYILMQWTDLVGHLNLNVVFTHRVFKSELIGLRLRHSESKWQTDLHLLDTYSGPSIAPPVAILHDSVWHDATCTMSEATATVGM
jgi:hypothetical protein